MLDKFSEDFVAASVFQAGDGGQKTHWNNLMVLHPHFNLFCDTRKRTKWADQLKVDSKTIMQFQFCQFRTIHCMASKVYSEVNDV